MGIIWSDPTVQAAAIQSIGGVLAATIAAIGAVVVGKRFLQQKRLLEKLTMMRADLVFLLAKRNIANVTATRSWYGMQCATEVWTGQVDSPQVEP